MASSSSDDWFTTTNGMVTMFTPAASCSSMWTYEPQSANSVSGGLLLQNLVYDSISKNSDCYPTGFKQWGRAPSFMQIFSPGVCPSGYATVGNLGGQGEEITTAICCPSNFGYTNAVSPVLGSNKTASFWGCTSTYPQDATPTTVFAAYPGGFTSRYKGEQTSFTTVSGPLLMWAQVVSIAFESKDLPLFTTSGPITSAPTSNLLISTAISSSTSATQSSLPTGSAAGISSGAIAGIVIGAVAVLSTLICLAYFLWLKKRRNKSPASQQPGYVADPAIGTAPPPTYKEKPFEAGGNSTEDDNGNGPWLREDHGVNELDGGHGRRHELGGGSY